MVVHLDDGRIFWRLSKTHIQFGLLAMLLIHFVWWREGERERERTNP